MRFLSFLIWIFLSVGSIENIECAITIKSNPKRYGNQDSSNLNIFNEAFKRYCSLVCNEKSDRTIVVQTANDNRTHVNVPLQDDIMAVVYYSCNETIINKPPTRDQYHTFQKVCDNVYEKCTNFSDSFHKSWVSKNKGVTQKLSVDLRVPSDLKHIKIRTKICERDPIIFTFKVDNKPIDYRQERNNYNYTNDNFFVNNLQKTPIVLEIKIFPKNVLAIITFNFTKTQTEPCSKFVQEHCPRLCQNGSLNVKEKCHLMVNNKSVEIATKPGACSTKEWNKNAAQEMVSEGTCAYFGSRNIRLCQNDCIDMPNCSYMCVQSMKNQSYNESGYYFHKDYSGILGSGSWTWEDVPSKMVLVNECLEIPGLCQSSESCEDKEIGYRCIKNDYNNMTCLKLKKYDFIQCHHDIETFVRNEKPVHLNFTKIKDYFENVRKSELPDKYKLYKISDWLIQIRNISSTQVNMTKTEEKNIIRYTISTLRIIFRNYMKRLFMERYRTYCKTQNGIYSYARPINKTEKVIDIPLSEKNATGTKQFVKLKINQPTDSSTVTFMHYKNSNLLDESNELDQKTRMYGVNRSRNQSDIKRFMNSHLITVTFDQRKNISIQFKLKPLKKVEPPNWLYSVEEECGYLKDDEWAWAVDGCRKVTDAGQDYCECDHLSNFAMLFSMKIINEKHLTIFKYLSILGGIVNVLSLLLFLVFVLGINSRDKLRIDQLNIAISLLMGTLVFIFGGLFVEHTILCKIAALLTQYLFLSAFAWMLILGINVVKLVSFHYQTEDWMVKYRVLIWVAGYVVSLVIVILSGSFNWAHYGRISDNVCWIDNRNYALLTFIVPVGIIIAINVIVLFYIANALIRNYINTRKIKVNESNELMVFIQLLVSMGFTWFPSYFATYYLAAMYLLVIFFPLQGLMMFLCIVVINKENREKVSSYILLRYSSLVSKSTTTSGTKSNSKSKSTSNSKNTEQNQSLLSDTEKEKEALRDTKESSIPLTTIRDQENTDSLHHHPEC